MAIKLLYYSTAYFASHGGSSHSRHFFAEAKKNPAIEQMLLFPEKKITEGNRPKSKNSFRDWIRGFSVLQVYFFYRRNKFHLSQLISFIEKEKPDAIIIRLDSNFLQLKSLRRSFPQLIIATEVNASPFDESFKNIFCRFYFKQLERRYLEQTSCNFFVSSALRSRIMGDNILPERDFVVHNGVDTSLFKIMNDKDAIRSSYNFATDQFIVGYIGTLDTHKKIDVLLKAFKELSSEFKDARLLIVGDGPEKFNLVALAEQLQIQDKVIFSGWCSHAEIPRYLNCFDLAIHHHASDYMSPIKLFEYMACGVAVIGPNTRAVKEVFVDGKHLIMTDGSVKDLVNKITDLLISPDKRKEIALAGRQLVEGNFTWTDNANFIVSQIHRKQTTRP